MMCRRGEDISRKDAKALRAGVKAGRRFGCETRIEILLGYSLVQRMACCIFVFLFSHCRRRGERGVGNHSRLRRDQVAFGEGEYEGASAAVDQEVGPEVFLEAEREAEGGEEDGADEHQERSAGEKDEKEREVILGWNDEWKTT